MLKQSENVTLSMNYAEYITEVKLEGKLLIKRLMLIVIFLALLAAGTWAVCGGIVNMPPIEILVLGACGIGFYFSNESTRIEYEYIVASSSVEFDAIYGNRKRKTKCLVSLKEAERIAPVNESTKSYIASKKPEVVYDFCSSKRSKRRYFLLANVKGKSTLVYFDAVSRTLDVFKFFRSDIVEIDKTIYEM